MKPNTSAITAHGVKQRKEISQGTKDFDRGIKRTIGRIKDVDRRNNGTAYILVDVPDGKGGMRPFGQYKTEVVIIDAPLDILHRWGEVKRGQIVELFYRGISETGQASARIIGDETEELVNARDLPEPGFSTASSLPFEPMGIL